MTTGVGVVTPARFSALQRAEIAEIGASVMSSVAAATCFSALQRAEIAEMLVVGFVFWSAWRGFSALQRAEIAEIVQNTKPTTINVTFQCSSTSRNC